MPGLFDDMVSPEEQRGIRYQNLFGNLVSAGLNAVAAGGSMMDRERAPYLAAAGQALGGMQAQNVEQMGALARQRLMSSQYAEAKQKIEQEKEWDSYVSDPAKFAAVTAGLPAELRAVAPQVLKRGGPAMLMQMFQHGNDAEAKRQQGLLTAAQIETLKREAARQDQFTKMFTQVGGGATPPGAAPAAPPQSGGATPPVGAPTAPPQSTPTATSPPVPLTGPQQTLVTSPITAAPNPGTPQNVQDVLANIPPVVRQMLPFMKPAELQAVITQYAAPKTKQVYDTVDKKFVYVPEHMAANPRYVSPEDPKFGLSQKEFDLKERQAGVEAANKPVTPEGQTNNAYIDAQAELKRREEEAKSQNDQKFGAAKELIAKAIADYEKDQRPKAVAAANGLDNLYEMKSLVDKGIAAGPAVDVRIAGRRAMEYLGMGEMPGNMVSRTEFNNRAAQRVMEIMASHVLGSGTAVGEGDRKFVERMAASGGGFTEAELKSVLDVGIKLSHKALEHHARGVERLKSLPGVAAIDPTYFNIQAQTYDEWKKKQEENKPEDLYDRFKIRR